MRLFLGSLRTLGRRRDGKGSTLRFDGFDNHALRALTLAHEESRRFSHNYVGAGLLESLGTDLERLRGDLNGQLRSDAED